jgi:hypothetical protein
MFEPTEHCKGEHELGYKIVIQYNKKHQDYMVTGYTLFNKNAHPYGHVSSSQDGATLHFGSMKEALDSIVNYPSKGK